MRRFILLLSSNAGLGYAPVASGTFGTLAGIPAYWLLAKLPPGLWSVTVVALFFLGCWAAGEAGKIYGVVDDGRIVIDELIGYLVAIAFLPFTWKTAIIGFILFRFFDIIKPQPARYFDRQIKNGYGVVLDDVVAGLYSALTLRMILHFFP